MISALEALITYFEGKTALTDLVSTRIAPRHRYREDENAWEIGDSSLIVRYDGGLPNRYTPEFFGRVELNCYGNTISDAELIYHELVTIARGFQDNNRETVSVNAGTALIYLFDLISSPTPLQDEAVEMPYLLVFGEIHVAEAAIV